MKIPKINFDFKGKSNPKTVTKSLIIYTGMNGNPNFPDITPTPAELNSAIVAFQDAIGAGGMGGKAAKEMREQLKQNLVNLLIQLAAAVTDVAKGDRAVLATSGFTISKETFSPRPLGSIADFIVVLGAAPASVKCSCKGVKNSAQYIFEYAPMPITDNTAWKHALSTKRECVITGFAPMKEYAFRLRVTGPRGQEAYSEVLTKVVL